MADPQIVNTLRNKRDQIERAIKAYEKQITDARADLSHINATLRLFEVGGERTQFPVHMGLARLFERGELFGLCKTALETAPEGLDTRQLALSIIQAKGLNETDKVLRQAVAYSIVNVMRRQAARGSVLAGQKRKGVRVWNGLA
ncbi:MAG: hypothetical protein WD073_01600 [Xanthobacteraceae bacterium]